MTEQTETKPANEFSVASTGARRSADADAIRLDLIPQLALKEVARVLAKGAESHGTYNWRKGTPHSTCINHCLNHLNQYLMGDRNTPHLAHAICNLMFLIEYLTIYPQGNDLLKAEDFLPLVELDGDPLYREAKRRARLMSADVHKELSKQAAAQTVNGQPVAGCFLTVMFLTVILPSLITWVIEQLILWIIKKNWPASTAGVQPATCSMLNNLTPCQEMDAVYES